MCEWMCGFYIYSVSIRFITFFIVCLCWKRNQNLNFKKSNYLSMMPCSYYSQAWWKPMLELPNAHFFLSVKFGVVHYLIYQSELPVGSPLSDIIMSFKVSGKLLYTELPMCSRWADIIWVYINSKQLLSTELPTASMDSLCAAHGLPICSPLFISARGCLGRHYQSVNCYKVFVYRTTYS